MSEQPAIRLMTKNDLPAVLSIERAVYVSIEPESIIALGSKLKVSPNTSWVAHQGGEIVGYLIALPWSRNSPPPALHEPTVVLPPEQDSLYLHDLALSPAAQGSGVGAVLVNQALDCAKALGLSYATLIAVQNSSSYWSKFGFAPVEDVPSSISAKISSYGQSAVYMRMKLK